MSIKDFYQTPQVDLLWRKKMLHWGLEREKVEGTLSKKEKEKRNRPKDPVHLKQTARERPQELSKS